MEFLRKCVVALDQKLWQSLHASLPVDARQCTLGLGQQLVAAEDAVFVVDPCTAGTNGSYLQSQRIAEFAWPMISTGDFVDDEQNAVALQVCVVVAQGKELLHPRQFKVLKIVSVVHETLRIGFVVANANFNFVIREHIAVFAKNRTSSLEFFVTRLRQVNRSAFRGPLQRRLARVAKLL